MRIAYVYGFGGIDGPMLLGALLDAGAPLAAVQEGWHRLQLPAVQVAVERVPCTDYTATRLAFTASHIDAFLSQHTYTTLTEYIVQRVILPRVRQRLLQVLTHFADAVTRVHGVQERDLALRSAFMPTVLYMGCGVATALEVLTIDQLLAAPVNLGAGPHPLVAALVRGASVYGEGRSGALTTADGVAILAGLATSFGPLPVMTVTGIGYGASIETERGKAHGLQVLLGEIDAQPTAERIAVLEANIDDMNPEFYEVIFERVFAQGALDVTLTPLLMKKGRPANKLTVLAPLPAVARLSRTILQETSTFGVRVYEVWRQKLERFVRQVETNYGVIPVKCGVLDGRIVQAAPEYEACKRAALEQNVPIRLVYTEAARLAASWLIEAGVRKE
jgi:hypothetical protein